jgi:hypothetical protein
MRPCHNSLDFHQEVSRKLAGLNGRPCRLGVGQQAAVDGVHGREISHVGEEDGRLDGEIPRSTGLLENAADILDNNLLEWF